MFSLLVMFIRWVMTKSMGDVLIIGNVHKMGDNKVHG